MYRFVTSVHVLFAVLLTGAVVFVPFLAVPALAARDAERIRLVGRWTLRLGVATLLIAGLGFGAMGLSEGVYRFGTPWVTISVTVYAIALLLDVLVLPAVLSRAAKHVDEAVSASPEVADTPNDPEAVAVAAALVDQHRGRLLGFSGLAVVLYGVVALLMAGKPFGS